MAGINETIELLDLLEVIGVEIAKEVKKDGFQPKDLMAFIKSPEFEAKLKPAVDKAEQIPSEVSDLNFLETISLAKRSWEMSSNILAVLGK